MLSSFVGFRVQGLGSYPRNIKYAEHALLPSDTADIVHPKPRTL